MSRALFAAILASTAVAAGAVQATDLYANNGFAALASDHLASRVGDTLTVVVYETSSATNAAQSQSSKTTHIGGQVLFGSHNDQAQLNLNGGYDGSAQSGRSGNMMAQISVTVDEVLPNGDMRVSGEQLLNINGDHTKIRIKGRVRRADIGTGNVVLSSRLADAMIDYDGMGFVGRGAKPGIVTRIFNWLGLI